jgi:hypothetical protein
VSAASSRPQVWTRSGVGPLRRTGDLAGRYLQLDEFVGVVGDRRKGAPTAFSSAVVYDEDRWG